MLCAASLRPAPATPMDLALNSASWFFRPSLMLPCRSAKKGSLKKASRRDNSNCFSCIFPKLNSLQHLKHSIWMAAQLALLLVSIACS